VGSQAKVLIPVGLLGLVVAALAFWRLGLAPGIGVLVVASLAVVAIGQRNATDAPDRPLAHRSPADRSLAEGWVETRERSWPADLLPDEPLATWSPPAPVDPLPAPPTETDGAPLDFPFADDELRALDEPPLVGETPGPEAEAAWDDGSTWSSRAAVTDRNPLEDLIGLDEVDVVAEVERLEAAAAPDTGPATVPFEPHMVNEAVSSPDDIIAASHATELAGDGPAVDNSELARLLAKVQARLAAYE
jgi:hypothetical protein